MAEGGGVDESEVRWLISYADFMMQLLCLFILLFSISSFEPKKLEAIESGYRTYKKLPRGPSAKAPAEGDNRSLPQPRRYEEGNRLVVGNTTPYKEGSADLDPSELPELDRLIEKIRGWKNVIEIYGHTSEFPEDSIQGDHLLLSYLRAKKVMEYMTRPKRPGDQETMIEPKRIRVIPMSYNQRAVDYIKPEAREKNRRVEIIVTSEMIQ